MDGGTVPPDESSHDKQEATMSKDTMSPTEQREYAEGWGAGYHSITVPVGTPTTAAWRQGYGHGACKRNRAATASPLVTILGGVGDTVAGDVTVIDLDDWNADEGRRQEIIEDIQRAGYRCVVYDDGSSIPAIQIFGPGEPYDVFINEHVSGTFAVYDSRQD